MGHVGEPGGGGVNKKLCIEQRIHLSRVSKHCGAYWLGLMVNDLVDIMWDFMAYSMSAWLGWNVSLLGGGGYWNKTKKPRFKQTNTRYTANAIFM